MNIPPDVIKILKTFNNSNFKAFIVGGCIRDYLLGRIPKDWDICTSATPTETKEIFRNQKVIDTGLKFGTITLVLNRKHYEITTFRIEEKYLNHRKPENITFTHSIEEDLARRDFTINSLAYNPDTGIIDLYHGQKDIELKLVRCVGNAEERFTEDALRILRAIRFSAKLSFCIEETTKSAIFKCSSLLKNISIERCVEEFNKILLSDYVCDILIEYISIFCEFFHELAFLKKNNKQELDIKHSRFSHIAHSLQNAPKDLIIRLTILLNEIIKHDEYIIKEQTLQHSERIIIYNEKVKKILKSLKYSNYIIKEIIEMIGSYDIRIEPCKIEIKKLLNRLGETRFRRLLVIKNIELKASKNKETDTLKKQYQTLKSIRSIFNDIIRKKECYHIKDLAINGDDLLDIGYQKGEKIGITLNKMLDLVINEQVKNDKNAILKVLCNQEFIITIHER